LVFTAEKREAAIAEVGTAAKPTEVMKKLAEMWNALNQDQKKPYQGTSYTKVNQKRWSKIERFGQKNKIW